MAGNYCIFYHDPHTVWVVRILDGHVAIQEMATEALAELIGPRLKTARDIPRFRAEFRRGRWCVVDGRTPGRAYSPGVTRAVAQLRAASWACLEALLADEQRRQAIYDAFASREEAEAVAERIRGLREARKRAGLSLAQAARLCGVSPHAVSAWERLRRLPLPAYLDAIEGAAAAKAATAAAA